MATRTTAKKAEPNTSTVKTSVKEAPAKTAAVKEAVKETETTAAKTVKETEKPAAKKVSEKKPAAKKTTAKKAAEKKEVNTEVYVQFAGKELCTKDAVEKVKAAWTEAGNKEEDLKDIKLYIKPEDNGVYYVINDDVKGFLGL